MEGHALARKGVERDEKQHEHGRVQLMSARLEPEARDDERDAKIARKAAREH